MESRTMLRSLPLPIVLCLPSLLGVSPGGADEKIAPP